MRRLARWISILAHPFVMVTLLVAVSAGRKGSAAGAAWSVALVTGAVLLPLALLMLLQVRRGRWSNVDASNPAERPVLFIVGIGGLAILMAWLAMRDAGSDQMRGTLVTGVLLLVAAVLTRWVKVSLHMAFATFTATALSLLGSPVGYALGAAVPALAWSRLALGRHRPLELALGAILGLAAGVALVKL